MAITGGDLVANAAVGAPHPRRLKAVASSPERLHGDLAANPQVGPPRPEPVSIVIGGRNLIDILKDLGYTGPVN